MKCAYLSRGLTLPFLLVGPAHTGVSSARAQSNAADRARLISSQSPSLRQRGFPSGSRPGLLQPASPNGQRLGEQAILKAGRKNMSRSPRNRTSYLLPSNVAPLIAAGSATSLSRPSLGVTYAPKSSEDVYG